MKHLKYSFSSMNRGYWGYYDEVGDDDGHGGLPLKSWYRPGTMMQAMANSLLKVRKI